MRNQDIQLTEMPPSRFLTAQAFVEQETEELRSLFETRQTRTVIVKKIDGILDFILRHFAIEESLMRGIAYPFVEQHIKDHDALRVSIEGIRAQLRRPNVQVKRGYPDFLLSLLMEHVFVFDLPLEYALSSITEARPNYLLGILPVSTMRGPDTAAA